MGSNQNGSNQSKNKKNTSAGEAPSQMQASVNQDTSMGQKLDALLVLVKDMDEKLKDQDDRRWKLDERASIHDMSVVPSTQTSPKKTKKQKPPSSLEIQSQRNCLSLKI